MISPVIDTSLVWQEHFREKVADAKNRLSSLNYPTVRDEEWKYTPLRTLTSKKTVSVEEAFVSFPQPTPDVRPHLLLGLDAHLLVWHNGKFCPELSRILDLPEGVIAGSVLEVANQKSAIAQLAGRLIKTDESAFTVRNTAFIQEGFGLHIEKGVTLNKPIMLLYLFDNHEVALEANFRNLIRLEKNAKASIIEKWVVSGTAPVIVPMSEISLGHQANLEHLSLQTDLADSCSVSLSRIEQEQDSIYLNDTLSWSGQLVRNNLETVHLGSNCQTFYNGLYLADSDCIIDNHTLVDHAVPHCESNETYKGIVSGTGKAVFNGKVMVRKDAQKTNAYQSNNTLLLGEQALVYAKPQLEIYADDVKCSHGATVGQVDGQELFYLRARGISEPEARKLLLLAFAGEIIDKVSFEQLRASLFDSLSVRLSQLS